MVRQQDIANVVGLDVSSVNKILNMKAGPVFHKDTIRKVFKVAKDMGWEPRASSKFATARKLEHALARNKALEQENAVLRAQLEAIKSVKKGA